MAAKLTEQSLNWAIKHVAKHGESNLLPSAFEYDAIAESPSRILDYLVQQDLDTWTTRPHRRVLAPKSKYLFRLATQLDPLDFLLLTALVYEISEDLETSRVAGSERVVFSHRFVPNAEGDFADPESNWGAFLKRCRELSKGSSYVVVADIADFYQRIYLHPLENALKASTTNSDIARIILKLIEKWNEGISYGIPIGPSATHLLAEVTINDVDLALQAKDALFCRFSDDFRIFCKNQSDAFAMLETLSRTLMFNHGLTLQPEKTAVLPVATFQKRYLTTERETEIHSLRESFEKLANQIGLENEYEEIEYESLPDDVKETIDSLNLYELLKDQLQNPSLNIPLCRFILRRLAQLRDVDAVPLILDHLDRSNQLVPESVRYLLDVTPYSANVPQASKRIVASLQNPPFDQSTFRRMWLLSVLARDRSWTRGHNLVRLYPKFSDSSSQRKLVLAMGRAGNAYWFRERKGDWMDLSPWVRRAFLVGASCMRDDERKYWYGSVRSRLDPLEQAVVAWARNNPFA